MITTIYHARGRIKTIVLLQKATLKLQVFVGIVHSYGSAEEQGQQ